MKIVIKQNKIKIFGSRYTAFQGEKKLFVIQRLFLSLFPIYKIVDYLTGERIGIIQNKLFALRGSAIISIPTGAFNFEQESVRSMKYRCEEINGFASSYELNGNSGFTGSITKNNVQIGEWVKNKLVFFEGDTYELELDFDADILLIACTIVLMDKFRISIKIGGDIGWELGNIGKDLQTRNSNWLPKEKN